MSASGSGMPVTVLVEDAGWSALLPDAVRAVEVAAHAALAAAKAEGDGEIVVLLTNDGEVRALNASFRGQDAPTNVLSFPASAAARGALGDIALALGVCRGEAVEQGKTLNHHLQHLVAHGVLHLLGYDHQTDAEAETMEAMERAIMAGLGVADPYAARANVGDRHG